MEDPPSAYPSLEHATQSLAPHGGSRVNYRCLILHYEIWQRLTSGYLGSRVGFESIKTAVGKLIWGGSPRGRLTALQGQRERLVGCRVPLAGHMGCWWPGFTRGWVMGRAVPTPQTVPRAPHSSSSVEMGLGKPQDTTGNIP